MRTELIGVVKVQRLKNDHVMAYRGTGGLRRWVRGSVADRWFDLLVGPFWSFSPVSDNATDLQNGRNRNIAAARLTPGIVTGDENCFAKSLCWSKRPHRSSISDNICPFA